MKRRHCMQDIYDFCEKARILREDIIFGADVIVGFPTENDEHFATTIKVLEENNIPLVHAFSYSPRKGTPAAKMPQVQGDIINRRMAIMQQTIKALKDKIYRDNIGKQVNILVEKDNMGYSEQYLQCKLISNDNVFSQGEVIQAFVKNYNEKGVLEVEFDYSICHGGIILIYKA